jgi:hypothetical protein
LSEQDKGWIMSRAIMRGSAGRVKLRSEPIVRLSHALLLAAAPNLSAELGFEIRRDRPWRDGAADPLCSRFGPRAGAHRAIRGAAACPQETLLIERPEGEPPQVLAFEYHQDDFIPRPGRHRQNAMAHRARLPGPQAGDRARPLPRARWDLWHSRPRACAIGRRRSKRICAPGMRPANGPIYLRRSDSSWRSGLPIKTWATEEAAA